MDPVTAAMLAAIAVGATAGLTDVAKAAIADAYSGLKALVIKKLGDDNEVTKAVVAVEAKPDSAGRKETLKEEIAAAGVAQDAEVLAAAKTLFDRVNTTSVGNQVLQTVTGDHNISIAGSGNTVTVTSPDSKKK